MTETTHAVRLQYMATGRRKESVARVRLLEGEPKIIVNKRAFHDYFPRESHRLAILQPLELVKMKERFTVYATITGGGTTGQAEGLRHGIARALVKMDANLKPVLKKAGFMTRDPRMRERKKYGRKRARRRFQFTKR